jgi:DNA-binding NtrC family response regulator
MSDILDIKPIERYGKVLIVDDEPDLREMVQEILESKKIKVTVAENPIIALEILANEKFDMILSDVSMPEMTGIQFLEVVCQKGDFTPFVFYSGFYEKNMLRKSMQLGAFDFLEKPISPKKLIAVVENAAEVGVLQRKINFIKERKNVKLFDFIAEYEKKIAELKLINFNASGEAKQVG